ncbi:multidrug effflux MFS transporter [Mycobacterium sp. CBMA271]|uniref:multidrug effflux MFS transporter n=1 Tax=unclassified Mycobacteroides TaxID=2618759 RepID=UPI0012DC4B20|nr:MULTISPECIES: multidrug effflux MFS transporter [unclassified Mycobacteroides]MUM16560.1 Bcr/CflA family drug resistance efflux transporter [Mycobacteroides sp. CBMA 326]MUM22133.1 multidrug effflux MFS transporter [Mycobacteroides sp. CBMA 271]
MRALSTEMTSAASETTTPAPTSGSPVVAPSTRLGRAWLITVLGAMVALGPLTIDMYLPALPDIGSDLHVTSTLTQLTLTGTLVGLGLGQLLVGPLSDSLGRRLPLIAGAALHVVASLAITVAPNIVVLGILRAIEGVGAAAAMVVAMAVVRDLYTDKAAATVISRLTLVIGIAPILAPSLGAAVLVRGSWHHVFAALSCLGVLLLILAVVALPETLPPAARRPLHVRSILQTYRDLLRDKVFVVLVLVAGLSLSGLFAYISGASFVLQGQYGMNQQMFAIVFGAGAIAFVAASQLNVVLLKRFEPQQIVQWCLSLALIPAVVLLVLAGLGIGGLVGFVAPVWTLMALMGFVIPNAPALALSRHGEAAGTSAAVLGASQFGVGAVIAPLVGALGNNALAVAVVMTIGVVLALVGLAVVRNRVAS